MHDYRARGNYYKQCNYSTETFISLHRVVATMDPRVRDAIRRHDIKWKDIDRIELKGRAYDEAIANSDIDITDTRTDFAPAIRRTLGEERIIYTEATGDPISVPIQ